MRKQIFESKLAKNGQVTLKKAVRELLQAETTDIIFLQVIKVETSTGITKYRYDPEDEGDDPFPHREDSMEEKIWD